MRVMIAPVIPGLNDHEIEALLAAARDAGAGARATWCCGCRARWRRCSGSGWSGTTRPRQAGPGPGAGDARRADDDPRWGRRMKGEGVGAADRPALPGRRRPARAEPGDAEAANGSLPRAEDGAGAALAVLTGHATAGCRIACACRAVSNPATSGPRLARISYLHETLSGSPGAPPTGGENPTRGQGPLHRREAAKAADRQVPAEREPLWLPEDGAPPANGSIPRRDGPRVVQRSS